MASNSADSANAALWSLSRLGEEFDLHRDTVRKRLRAAGVQAAGRLHGKDAYRLREAAAAILQPEIGGGSGGVEAGGSTDPELLDPDERDAWYRGEKRRLEIEEHKRNLVHSSEMAREMAALVKAVGGGLDALPDTLERDAGLDAASLDVVQRTVDAMRESIYQEYAGDEPADTE